MPVWGVSSANTALAPALEYYEKHYTHKPHCAKPHKIAGDAEVRVNSNVGGRAYAAQRLLAEIVTPNAQRIYFDRRNLGVVLSRDGRLTIMSRLYGANEVGPFVGIPAAVGTEQDDSAWLGQRDHAAHDLLQGRFVDLCSGLRAQARAIVRQHDAITRIMHANPKEQSLRGRSLVAIELPSSPRADPAPSRTRRRCW